MIGAAEGAAVALALGQKRTAMTARVGKGMNAASAATHHDHRNAGEFDSEIISGIRNTIVAPDEVPDLHENGLHLPLVELGRGVALRW